MIQNANTTFFGTPIDTVLSVDSIVENETIIKVKRLMNEKYGNKYSHIPPHLSYALVPLPVSNLEKAKNELVDYINNQRPYTVEFSELKYGERNNIFFIEILRTDKRLRTCKQRLFYRTGT